MSAIENKKAPDSFKFQAGPVPTTGHVTNWETSTMSNASISSKNNASDSIKCQTNPDTSTAKSSAKKTAKGEIMFQTKLAEQMLKKAMLRRRLKGNNTKMLSPRKLTKKQLNVLREEMLIIFVTQKEVDDGCQGIIKEKGFKPSDKEVRNFAKNLMQYYGEKIEVIPKFDEYDDYDYYHVGNEIWKTTEDYVCYLDVFDKHGNLT